MGKGRAGRIFKHQLEQYQECDVTWNSKVDVSAFGRDIDNAHGFEDSHEGSGEETTEATTAVTDVSLVEGRTESESIFNNEKLYTVTEQPELSIIEKNAYIESTTKNNEVEVREEYNTEKPSFQP